MIVAVLVVAALDAAFYLGARYGRRVEARALALDFRVMQQFRAEYRAVLADIRVRTDALSLNNFRRYL